MLESLSKQANVPGAAQLARRQSQIDEALGETRPAPAQAAPVALTPAQMSDWQAVGLGQMKLGEFRQRHGFIPN